MSQVFNAYEGFKMACLTCYRTLTKIDGMEVGSKLLWCILAMYQAISYGMLFDKAKWIIEKDESNTYKLTEAIEKSLRMEKFASFVKKFLHDEENYKQQINDIEDIRDNVIHANAPQLKKWESNINYLVKLMDLCTIIVTEITHINDDDTNAEEGARMRRWWETLKGKLDDALMDIPSN